MTAPRPRTPVYAVPRKADIAPAIESRVCPAHVNLTLVYVPTQGCWRCRDRTCRYREYPELLDNENGVPLVVNEQPELLKMTDADGYEQVFIRAGNVAINLSKYVIDLHTEVAAEVDGEIPVHILKLFNVPSTHVELERKRPKD